MKIMLSPNEARLLGCFLEKQLTTPDQYPLSLNGVLTACNQKSNREPVMTLTESAVQDTLDMLVKKHLVTAQSGFGQRVVKYEHRFCNTEFGQLTLAPAEIAVIATLLLRGAQTPGELRTRAARLHEFSDVGEVESTLEHLQSRDDGPFVARLPRDPGKRESRFVHLFSGEPDLDAVRVEATQTGDDDLRQRVSELEREMADIKQQLANLLKGE